MYSLFRRTLTKTTKLHPSPISFSSSNYSTTPKFHSRSEEPSTLVQGPSTMAENDETCQERAKVLRRPSKIPFQSKVANLLNLIGTVRMPIEFVTTPDGKSWAGTIISQDQSSVSSPLLWIPIIFEGDLAHTAVTHVKVLDNVYVAGQLSPDPLPINLTNDRVDVQVMVHDLHFVRGCHNLRRKISTGSKQQLHITGSSGSPPAHQWHDLSGELCFDE